MPLKASHPAADIDTTGPALALADHLHINQQQASCRHSCTASPTHCRQLSMLQGTQPLNSTDTVSPCSKVSLVHRAQQTAHPASKELRKLGSRFSTLAMAGEKENVWDYPRPPKLEPTSRHITVILGGTVIADTTSAYRVLETSHPPTYYLPPSDCKLEYFSTSGGNKPTTTICEWKGRATYHDVQAGGQVAKARVWSYEQPTAAFAAIQGYLSFYASPFTCTVDGEVVQAQPGDFYGGWITSDVEGPFKGAAGTMGW